MKFGAMATMRFDEALKRVGGDVMKCAGLDSARKELQGYLRQHGCKTVASSNHALVDEVLADRAIVTSPFSAETTDASITGADFLIEETGTVAIVTRPDCPRLLFILPPIHIVVARSSQIVPDLAACLARLPAVPFSSLTLITGQSRTADIEKILVTGVHGPKRLAVVLLE